jgi:hypothetical protein
MGNEPMLKVIEWSVFVRVQIFVCGTLQKQSLVSHQLTTICELGTFIKDSVSIRLWATNRNLPTSPATATHTAIAR